MNLPYPVCNDWLIVRQIILLKDLDENREKFINNASAYSNWTNDQLSDALEQYARPVRLCLERIILRAKTVQCKPALDYATKRLNEMQTPKKETTHV